MPAAPRLGSAQNPLFSGAKQFCQSKFEIKSAAKIPAYVSMRVFFRVILAGQTQAKPYVFLCQSAFGRFFFVSEKIREKREELMCAAVGGTIRKERPDHRPLFIFVGNAIAGFHANFNNPPSSDTVPPAGRWGRPACGRGCPEWPAPAPAPRSHGLPPAAYPPECAPCSAKSRCHGR